MKIKSDAFSSSAEIPSLSKIVKPVKIMRPWRTWGQVGPHMILTHLRSSQFHLLSQSTRPDPRMGAANVAGLPGHMHRSGSDEMAGGGSWKFPRGAECSGAVVQAVIPRECSSSPAREQKGKRRTERDCNLISKISLISSDRFCNSSRQGSPLVP